MKKYFISFKHKIIQSKLVEVSASSEEEAIEKAEKGEWLSDEEILDENGLETFDYEIEDTQ